MNRRTYDNSLLKIIDKIFERKSLREFGRILRTQESAIPTQMRAPAKPALRSARHLTF